MKLKTVLNAEQHQALPEQLREFYAQATEGPLKGRFVLDAEEVDGFALDNVGTLKSSLNRERSLRETAEVQLRDFSGLSAAEAREAIKKLDEIKNWSKDEKTKEALAAAVADAKRGLEKELGATKTSLEKANERWRKLAIDSAAAAAIAKHKGDVDLLMPFVRSAAEIKEKEDGSFSVIFKGPDGFPLPSRKAGNDGPMDFEEFTTGVLRDRFPRAFDGHGGSGSGAGNGAPGAGGALKPWQIKSADLGDHSKYKAVKAEANKVGRPIPEVID